MTLGIISAMSEELEILLQDMKIDSKETKANMIFHKGMVWNTEAVAVVCGIGKVNAAVCAQILISEYKVDKVINVGVAGGVGKEIYPGDVVIGDNLVQYDMDTTSIDEIMEIADNGFVMPPKSTWFEPKLRSGLFIHSLE